MNKKINLNCRISQQLIIYKMLKDKKLKKRFKEILVSNKMNN